MADYAVTEEVDLGLQELPESFDLQPLFPGDQLLRFHPNWFVSDFQQKEAESSFTAAAKTHLAFMYLKPTNAFRQVS